MTEKIHWIKTHCARMDHGGCALLVGVKDNKIVQVKGDPDGYLNKGYVCPKALASPDRLTHPSRLRHPLKRKGKRGEGNWERISWPEAIQTISENLSKIREGYGAKSVAFCQGMPKGLEHFVLIRLANLFGSPNLVAVQDVCHAPREVSGMHTCGFYPVADFHHQSKTVILWGSNVTGTNEEGEICSLLLNQIKQGTELIVVDPKKTDLAKKAKFWLQIKPGTDNALALAFLNVIIEEGLYDKAFVENWTHGFEELATHVKDYTPEKMSQATWVPADLIRESARYYAASHPAAIQWGNPIEQNINTFDTSRALVCLMAICGNLDVPGGNIQANEPRILGLGPFVRADLIPSKRKEMIHAHHHTIPRFMTVPPAFFKKAVLEGFPYPVRGAYIQCANPLMGYTESPSTFDALMSLDFFAVSDIFMTPTASLADIVLPAATHFEFNDIGHYGLGHGHILARPKVVDPPEECWPDMKILNELGKNLTSGEYWHEDYEGFLDMLLKPAGLNYEQFVEQGYLKGEDRFKKYEASGFKTPTGKAELRLSRAEKFNLSPLPRFTGPPEADDPEYPLILTSSKDRYYLHSSYRWVEKLRKHSPRPVTEIHPETAAEYGVAEGDELVIETRSGSITQFAHLTEKIQPGVVFAAYGWWFPEGKSETQYEWKSANFNMLTSVKTLGKEFGTPNLKGLLCRIRRKK
ncbi:molybdopterin-containing oxidoreductase family protein [Desulfonema magnum]|uniref:Molybdopterin oxidoreductase n=1 Tax=Desulfonema magnum TaxID=45655 RepID=A0A975GMD6_9BACT|nr:molybdopterin-dependent oxidoreductase [Desulfonema magnum]QTA85738.1 Molybdopterin oxidoreductase [Desulfonema magnum]